MGHKEERVETLLGTRSEPANLAATHRGHKPLPTCCCTRLHNRQRPKLVRRGLQRMPQSKQSGSSRLLFGSTQGKIRAAHIVPRLLAWANTRAVVSGDGHHGRQGTHQRHQRSRYRIAGPEETAMLARFPASVLCTPKALAPTSTLSLKHVPPLSFLPSPHGCGTCADKMRRAASERWRPEAQVVYRQRADLLAG
jgi:hypothetical protein